MDHTTLARTLETNDPRIAVYTVTAVDQCAVMTDGSVGFPSVFYGEFKYGNGLATDLFAELMAKMLIDTFGAGLANMFVASSGTKYVASAASNLLQSVVTMLTLLGHTPRGVFRIDRGVVKAVDYATLNHEERQTSNAGREVRIPEVSRREISDHPVIVIDDIRISGCTEAETRRALQESGITNVVYAYLVQLADDVPTEGVEALFNRRGVSSLDDLVTIVRNGHFLLNARTCKFILRAPVVEVDRFARIIPLVEARRIIAAMVADGYHTMPEHVASFAAFVRAVSARIPRYS